jgi:hypothetical protein
MVNNALVPIEREQVRGARLSQHAMEDAGPGDHRKVMSSPSASSTAECDYRGPRWIDRVELTKVEREGRDAFLA